MFVFIFEENFARDYLLSKKKKKNRGKTNTLQFKKFPFLIIRYL